MSSLLLFLSLTTLPHHLFEQLLPPKPVLQYEQKPGISISSNYTPHLSLSRPDLSLESAHQVDRVSIRYPVPCGMILLNHHRILNRFNYSKQQQLFESIATHHQQSIGFHYNSTHLEGKVEGGVDDQLQPQYNLLIAWRDQIARFHYRIALERQHHTGREHMILGYDPDRFNILSPFRSITDGGTLSLGLKNRFKLYGTYHQSLREHRKEQNRFTTFSARNHRSDLTLGGALQYHPFDLRISYQQNQLKYEGSAFQDEEFITYTTAPDQEVITGKHYMLKFTSYLPLEIAFSLHYTEIDIPEFRAIIQGYPFSRITTWLNGNKLINASLKYSGYDLGINIKQYWSPGSIQLDLLWNPGEFEADYRVKTRAFLISSTDIDQSSTISSHLLKLNLTGILNWNRFQLLLNYRQLIPLHYTLSTQKSTEDREQNTPPATITGGASFQIILNYKL